MYNNTFKQRLFCLRETAFLTYCRLALCVVAFFCAAWMCALLWQGRSDEALDWLMVGNMLLLGPMAMARADKVVLPSQKKKHFAVVACTAAMVVYFAWRVAGSNPWLVCSCLAACTALTYYLEHKLLFSIGENPSCKFVFKHLSSGLLYAVATCGAFALATTAYAGLVAVMLGAIMVVHGTLIWFNLRLEHLVAGQYIDIWPRYLLRPSETKNVWMEFQVYIYVSKFPEYSPNKVLDDVIATLDIDTLLMYFFIPQFFDYDCTPALTHAVKTRLCSLDPVADAMFSMHEDDVFGAATALAKMHNPSILSVDMLDLPAMEPA